MLSILSPSSLRQKLANSRLFFIFGCLFLASQLLIAYIISPLDGARLVQLQTTFSVTTFQQIIADWESQNLLRFFYQHQIFDLFLHPVWYSIFLGAGLALSMNAAKIAEKYNAVLILPFIAGICDVLENSMHLILITYPDFINTFTVRLSACFASGKWFLVIVCGLIILYWGIKGKLIKQKTLLLSPILQLFCNLFFYLCD